jgi:hypothetical protein
MDRYTKGVLTVIAVALSALAIEQAVPQAKAEGKVCGHTPSTPCYVDVTNPVLTVANSRY